MDRFGNVLKSWIQYRGFGSQKAFALKAGVDQNYISLLARGKENKGIDTPNEDRQAQILKALKVKTIEEFYAGPPVATRTPKNAVDLAEVLHSGTVLWDGNPLDEEERNMLRLLVQTALWRKKKS